LSVGAQERCQWVRKDFVSAAGSGQRRLFVGLSE